MAYTDNIKTGQAYRVLVNEDPTHNTYDLISFWTAASDVEFSNHTTLEDISGTFYYYTATLPVGETSLTISGDKINDDAMYDFYVPEEYCTYTPSSVQTDGNQVTVSFPAPTQELGPMEVRLVCKNYQPANPVI